MNLMKWLNQNHLTVNTKKTECMYFRSDQNIFTAYSPIKLNSETLNITDTYKYLGITFDTHLNYKMHVENLTKQLKQKMFVYSKIRSHITKSTSATYLNAIILSTLSYCLPLWSLTSQTTLNPVIQLYNRAYKIHANLHLRSHHCNALQESNALHFENYCKLLAIKLFSNPTQWHCCYNIWASA